MKRLTLIFTCFLLSMGLAIGQNVLVSGTVLDEYGEPVIGASIEVKGNASIGTISDVDGKFSLDVPASAQTLIVNSVGMERQEVAVAPVVTIILRVSDQELDEIIVVAYGTAKKSSFTGSAGVVSASTIEKRQASNVTKSLQGAVAGVQGLSLSGQPGSAATLRIRGTNSISASASPLYVVDGIPFEGNMNSINTMDIESITVLKDAAANSMYGARGANGVVLITTRSGKAGKTKVTFESRFGANQRGIPAYDVVRDPGQYLELEWESLRNRAIADGNLNPNQWASDNLFSNEYGTGGYNPYGNLPANQVIIDGKLNSNAQLMYWDDWLDIPFTNGFRNEEVITISGGHGGTTYYMSGGYLQDNSYIENSKFERYSGRAKVDQQVTDWFKTGFNISYAKTLTSSPWSESSANAYQNIFMYALGIAPIYPVYQYDQATGQPLLDENGKKMYDYGTTMGKRNYGSANFNPLASLENDTRGTDRDQTTAIGYVEFTFLKDFKLLADIAIENYNEFSNSFQNPLTGDAADPNTKGRNYRVSNKFFGLNAKQLLTWNRSFGLHNVDILLGHESKSDKFNYLEGVKEMFLVPDNPELNNASRTLGTYSYQGVYSIESYLSRAQYNYADKYYLSASFRRDGSSRFHPDNRWGNFWSVGGAWRINQETFMNSVEFINDLKLKTSYGIQGNDRVLNQIVGGQQYNTYEDQYDVTTSITKVYRGAEITWENSRNFNVGLEFSFLNHRIKGGLEYYNKTTEDLLYRKNLPLSMGSPTWVWDNAISMRNQGFELELSVDIIRNNDLVWTVGGNITSLDNKILKLPDDRDPDGKGYRAGNYYYKVGNSIYDWHMYEYAGVDPATGQALWWHDEKDADGNVTDSYVTSVYADATYREMGKSAFNDFYGGVNTYLQYKGFDFSVLCSYAIGGYMYDGTYLQLTTNLNSPGDAVHKDVLERRWTEGGQITDVPKVQYGLNNQNATSSRYLTSRSYFSIQNVTLGYTLPAKITNQIGIEKLRFYAVADELYLNSARKGMDPRLYDGGTTTYAYSTLRSISFGFNINF